MDGWQHPPRAISCAGLGPPRETVQSPPLPPSSSEGDVGPLWRHRSSRGAEPVEEEAEEVLQDGRSQGLDGLALGTRVMRTWKTEW